MTRTSFLTAFLAALTLTGLPAAADGDGDGDRWRQGAGADPEILQKIREAYERASTVEPDDGAGAALVGTWRVSVTSPDLPPFQALHTYHADGTFTETSSLLPAEGPAHGAWRRGDGDYILTFELFAFEEGKPTGIVRVRNRIGIGEPDRLSAVSAVDLIAADGSEQTDMSTATFEGVRLSPHGEAGAFRLATGEAGAGAAAETVILPPPNPISLCGSLGRSCCVIGEIDRQGGGVITRRCLADLACIGGICRNLVLPCGDEGEACCPVGAGRPRCASRLSCIDGICVAPSIGTCGAQVGEPCCPGGACAEGLRCVVLPGRENVCGSPTD